MNTVFIALGSNLNNPIYHLEKGIRDINHLSKTRVIKRSSLYKSKPIGPQNQPNYINAVIKVITHFEPISLLDVLQDIENKHHRKRIKRWGPRTLDLDILIFNDLVINHERLVIPHPEIINREFVLVPLREITNHEFIIPKYGKLIQYI
ncbi:MAG: 2-amino-4-hydroxy-6-hydroxymethyldihydropteridine diphosphokinase [Gammaproteobacteria bacterium]|nr:2-amino-4-hydroxy-6-hydroxymethyldihydropteridine diphosphokinase [Gammaproteobacteria bacterium]MBT4462660.1 2-amino-4-hydroxy-6-hydroxymethyldihydropteridine diphosphokinase [Gammaproteobacteria bacterium]MBT4654907.1 2-amino-4-hydroxy-6-hydroxymethyldihydropteridine diphosphokinase [Gammaproteobacteria bacterium]MBT5116593.1 2-amino-4-hydroxy-6-hydroxymethyldihydropteridine diphosphokinase [Gammaproteobacteria bacterium]MBT5761780.1 2-amino-4-hydroxy-6-hydroxymethyldihydropteridine diphos